MPIIIHPSATGSGGRSVFIVNVGTDSTGYVADKTFTQIKEACDRGYVVQAKFDNKYIPLFSESSSTIVCQLVVGVSLIEVSFLNDNSVTLTDTRLPGIPLNVEVTLLATDWDASKSQTVEISAISSDETSQMVKIIPSDEDLYVSYGIEVEVYSDGVLKFVAEDVPAEDLHIAVVIEDLVSANGS